MKYSVRHSDVFRVVLDTYQYLKARLQAHELDCHGQNVLPITVPYVSPQPIEVGSLVHLHITDLGLIGRGPIIGPPGGRGYCDGIDGGPLAVDKFRLYLDLLLPLENAIPFELLAPYYHSRLGLKHPVVFTHQSGKRMDGRDARIEQVALHTACLFSPIHGIHNIRRNLVTRIMTGDSVYQEGS